MSADDAVAAALRAAVDGAEYGCVRCLQTMTPPLPCECERMTAAAVAAFLRAMAAPGASVVVPSTDGGYVLHVSAVAIIGLAAAVERAGAQEGGG